MTRFRESFSSITFYLISMTQQDNNINPNEENQDSTILEEIAQTAADETISS